MKYSEKLYLIRSGIEYNIPNVEEVTIESGKYIVSVNIDGIIKKVHININKCNNEAHINFRYKSLYLTIYTGYLNSMTQLGFEIGMGLCHMFGILPKTKHFLMKHDKTSYYVVKYDLFSYYWLVDNLDGILSHKYDYHHLIVDGINNDVLHFHLYGGENKHDYKFEVGLIFNEHRTIIESCKTINVFLYDDDVLIDKFLDVENPQLKNVIVNSTMKIDSFKGEYSFLSNFAPVEIEYECQKFSSVEHAYIYAKTDNIALKMLCLNPNIRAGELKVKAKQYSVKPNWDEIKKDVMIELCASKFHKGYYKDKLLETKDSILIEGNKHRDFYWGVCDYRGENILGKILMKIRDCLNTGIFIDFPKITKKQSFDLL